MNLEDLARMGEFLGGLAILISLIYLIIELRRQDDTAKANASSEWTTMFHRINFEMARDPILAPLMTRAFDPASRRSDYSDEDWLRFILFARSLYCAWRGAYILQAKGGLPEDLWQVQLSTARGLLELTIWKEWWDSDAKESVGADFVAAVERHSNRDYGALSGKSSG
ncbi:MAG: hypothetical protein AAF993_18960 [Pseudomonadota bacterium]